MEKINVTLKFLPGDRVYYLDRNKILTLKISEIRTRLRPYPEPANISYFVNYGQLPEGSALKYVHRNNMKNTGQAEIPEYLCFIQEELLFETTELLVEELLRSSDDVKVVTAKEDHGFFGTFYNNKQ